MLEEAAPLVVVDEHRAAVFHCGDSMNAWATSPHEGLADAHVTVRVLTSADSPFVLSHEGPGRRRQMLGRRPERRANVELGDRL